MPDFPANTVRPNSTVISMCGDWSAAGQWFSNSNVSYGSVAWTTANKATYLPFQVDRPMTIYQMAWENGATIATNLDVGIYDVLGNQLVSSGSIAHSGASVAQAVDITDTALLPGTYYAAMVFDGTTQTIFGCAITAVQAQVMRVLGVQQQTSAFPLPATATFANPTNGTAPMPVSLTLAGVPTI
jgi:hypothetical protein